MPTTRPLAMLPDHEHPGRYLVMAGASVEARAMTLRQAQVLLRNLDGGDSGGGALGTYTVAQQGPDRWVVLRHGVPVGSATTATTALALAAAHLEDEAADSCYRMAAYYLEVREAAACVLEQQRQAAAVHPDTLDRLGAAVVGTWAGACLSYDLLRLARCADPATAWGADIHEALRSLAALDRTALRQGQALADAVRKGRDGA